MTRTRLLAIAVIAPIVVTVAAIVVAAVLLPDLGRELAVHWGPDGRPDGFAPAGVVLVSAGALGVAVPLLTGLSLVERVHRGTSANDKVLAVTPLFVAGVLDGLLVWTFATQRDPAAGIPDVGPGLLVGFGAGLLLAAVAWFALPKVDAASAAAPPAPQAAMPLAADERAVWVGRTALAPRARLVIGILVVVLLGAVLAATVVTGGRFWGLLFVPVVLVLLFAGTAAWTVRVDATGLTVRSSVGWPAFHVRAAEIVSAGVTTVSPVAEFGGWGLRWAPGRRFGVVTRGGEALEVTVRGDRRFVVTVDDAATAAALLAAVRAR